MVPGDRPVIVLVKLPVPFPSVVLEFAVVGLGVVLQQTPRDVTFAPPSLMMLPPPVSVVDVTDVILVVAITGIEAGVVIVISFP